MAGRNNTLTRWIGDMVDDTKDFIDDILDRAGDVEGAMSDVGAVTTQLPPWQRPSRASRQW